ncbi:MAG: response regulator transcription factor [Candidatus Gastranaerophilales bacterium]|nr:response regulator transcription factor [Candidatus Gastranaerophilales bacterium]
MSSSIAKILIIDDNPKYMADALPMYGYEVEVATDGLKAMNKLAKNHTAYDLVLLDVMMPNMDGWDTLKAIRSNKKTEEIPVIMITAVNEEQKQISGLKFGADDYITKPFILPNLLARIEALLRRSSWQKNKNKNVDYSFSIEGDIEPLTAREKEVLKMVAKGASNATISEKLFVREVTVKTHLNSIFKKLKVSNRTQAVLLAMQMKIIDD